MSASSVLLVAASIVATNGGLATIDAGEAQLLEPGDRGQAHYELVVDGVVRRIEVGPVVVATVSEFRATVATAGAPLRPGHRVELRLPPERLNRPVPAPAPADAAPAAPPSNRPVSSPTVSPAAVPAESPAPAPTVPSTMGTVAVTPPVPSDPSAAPPVLPRRNAFTIPTGHYAIGLNPGEAQFHDQTPRHEVLLQAFTIDRYLVGKDRSLAKGGTPATGLTFFDAQERCAQLGLRLPTEQEWEIAAQDAGFKTLPGVFEWTDSWYEGYPGNTRSEEGYGQIHKVLKGSEDGSTEAVFARRFMSPNQLNPQVGFRCVKDQP